MSVLALISTSKALGAGRRASFLGTGGTGPYTYAVIAGGAGGTIDASTGVYQAPAAVNPDPKKTYDVIKVTDSLLAEASTKILVGDTLKLFCEIIQSELNLAVGRVYLYNQNIIEPKDSELYVVVSIVSDMPFANINAPAANGGALASNQSVSLITTLGIDIYSKNASARDRRFEILTALASTYSQQQQEANGFYIGKLPSGSAFTSLSSVDGAAIPYRFHIDIKIQHVYTKSSNVDYYDTFDLDAIKIDP